MVLAGALKPNTVGYVSAAVVKAASLAAGTVVSGTASVVNAVSSAVGACVRTVRKPGVNLWPYIQTQCAVNLRKLSVCISPRKLPSRVSRTFRHSIFCRQCRFLRTLSASSHQLLRKFFQSHCPRHAQQQAKALRLWILVLVMERLYLLVMMQKAYSRAHT
jgi:hypothetical protein